MTGNIPFFKANGKTYANFYHTDKEHYEHSAATFKLIGIEPTYFKCDSDNPRDNALLIGVDVDKGGDNPALYDIYVAVYYELSKAYEQKLEKLGFPCLEHFKKTGKIAYLGCEWDFWPEMSEKIKNGGI